MRILLISLNREAEPFTAAPLGLAKVASSLKADGHDVRCLDLLFADDPYKAMADALAEHSPGMVGLSLRNIESSTEFLLPVYKKYVDHIKSHTRAPIIVGGPGFSVMPGPVMKYLKLELGIAGEGDGSFAKLVTAMESGGIPLSIPNVCSYKNGLLRLPIRKSVCPPEEFAAPAWEMFPVDRYDMVGVQSKRGCTFQCAYCTYPNIEGRRMRLSDPGSVAGEMASIEREHGVSSFYFVDNVFNNPKSHAEAVCKALIDARAEVEWGALVSPNGFDYKLAGLMKDAGCVSVEIGADSLSYATLRSLGKSFGPHDVEYAVRSCKDAGLMHMVFLILGGPGEDDDTLKETFDRLDDLEPDKVFAVSGVRIYPNTPIAALAAEEGLIDEDSDLLIPEFYVSPALGDRLYGIADEYFGGHPDWIHYRADGVLDGPRKESPAPASVIPWSDDALAVIESVMESVPRLMRPIARRAVTKKAATLAEVTGRVGVYEVRDAFMSETPGPFRKMMVDKFREMGLAD